MTKQTIEELVLKIKEKAGYLWYNHGAGARDSQNDVVLGGSYDHDHFYQLSDEYIRAIYNEELIDPILTSTMTGYNPERDEAPWVKYGRLFVPSGETKKELVSVTKKIAKKVPKEGFLGKLGFTEIVDSYESVKEPKDVPIYQTKPWPSDKNIGIGYLEFGLWTRGCNRDGRGFAQGGSALIVLPTDIQETPNYNDNDLLAPIVEFLKQDTSNIDYLLEGIFDEKRFPKSNVWMKRRGTLAKEYPGKIIIVKDDFYDEEVK